MVLHGGPDELELERLGLRAEELIDFSVSTNPLGPSLQALGAAREAELGRYPDRHVLALRRALSSHLSIDPECVLVGNGSAELIWLVALAFGRRGGSVVVLEPTFGEYGASARVVGAERLEWRADPSSGFRVDVSAVAGLIRAARPDLVYACNPNNPTGTWLARPDLDALLEAVGGGLLVIDEAYLELSGRQSPALPLLKSGNLAILRSMTKDYGLPGLRLGYALATAQLVQALATVQPPWSVSAAAQAAGLAALRDQGHVAAGRRAAAEARAFLEPRLSSLGYPSLPSAANFWLVEVGDAATVRSRLLERGILVRDCASFGLPAHMRLAARPLPECERLVQALESL